MRFPASRNFPLSTLSPNISNPLYKALWGNGIRSVDSATAFFINSSLHFNNKNNCYYVECTKDHRLSALIVALQRIMQSDLTSYGDPKSTRPLIIVRNEADVNFIANLLKKLQLHKNVSCIPLTPRESIKKFLFSPALFIVCQENVHCALELSKIRRLNLFVPDFDHSACSELLDSSVVESLLKRSQDAVFYGKESWSVFRSRNPNFRFSSFIRNHSSHDFPFYYPTNPNVHTAFPYCGLKSKEMILKGFLQNYFFENQTMLIVCQNQFEVGQMASLAESLEISCFPIHHKDSFDIVIDSFLKSKSKRRLIIAEIGTPLECNNVSFSMVCL